LKTGQCLRIAGNVFRQEFKRDKTMEPRVLSLVDDTHAPTAQLLDDAVVRDSLADHRVRGYGALSYEAAIRESMKRSSAMA
jgi:hypothetical protein